MRWQSHLLLQKESSCVVAVLCLYVDNCAGGVMKPDEGEPSEGAGGTFG